MTDLKDSETYENLVKAFSQESRANRLYLYFAGRAELEGHPEVAQAFLEAAEGETGHAMGHLDYLRRVGEPMTGRPIGRTLDNLKAAAELETREHRDLYPAMAETARREGFTDIAEWFESLARAEHSHSSHFREWIDRIEKRKS